VAVRGSFDDCQRLVKEALADDGLRNHVTLTTGNSINLGRLLPQAVYYVHAWSRLEPRPERLVVSVPSGNLGNLCAGVLAQRMGLPVDRFVAATNENDVAVRYLETGRLDPGPSHSTLSSAMDVARPSNLERLIHFTGGDLDGLRDLVRGSAHDDRQTLEAMAELHDRYGYLADPHTAVGWLGLEDARSRGEEGLGLVLSTADPAKFPDVVERAAGRKPSPRPDWLDPEEVDERAARVPRLDPERGSLAPLLVEGRQIS
jgi:threonine synthase